MMVVFSKLVTAPVSGKMRPTVCGMGLMVSMLVIFSLLGSPAQAELDLADAPLFTQIQPPPSNVVILMDDSGSMSASILVKHGNQGPFPDSDSRDRFWYVFEDFEDGARDPGKDPLDAEARKLWQSQYYRTNVMYFNPHANYKPWPDYGATQFIDYRLVADEAIVRYPRSHPIYESVPVNAFDMDAEFFSIDGEGGDDDQVVINAHYFDFSDEENCPYLVMIDGPDEELKYYKVTDADGDCLAGENLDEKVQGLSPVAAGDLPGDVKVSQTYAQMRRNFANWFTYHRRREFTAKFAVATFISRLREVRVGILGINKKVVVALQPVKIDTGGPVEDETDLLLEKLYDYVSYGWTPLKKGLHIVGKFFEDNNKWLAGKKGEIPYVKEEDGGACQQSFSVMVTDGFYSDDDYDAGGYGNFDGYDKVKKVDRPPPYADEYDDTLADTAMYFYETDLNALPDQVPVNQFDQATHQHMVTYAVAFGVSGTLIPDEYILDPTSPNYLKKKSDLITYVDWPRVTDSFVPQTIDDLWHATVNGRGSFLNASDPQDLIDALTAILDNIFARRTGSAASVTVNGQSLYATVSDELLIFQSSYSYDGDEWGGDVKAFKINTESGEVLTADPVWEAQITLNARLAEEEAKGLETGRAGWRKILSYDGKGSGIFFKTDDGNLTPEQKAALGEDWADLVEYLRGEPVDGYRERKNVLADIVHSAPVFENNIVYVGANDGMLHAFNVLDKGNELFAYVPNLVFENLSALADPGYTHQYYVDLTPTVKKGKGILGDEDTVATLLVGGLGKGGRGFFALDVSRPGSMKPDQVKWEFPDAGTVDYKADMGYSYSRPVIVRSNLDDGDNDDWIVIIGNGYDSQNGHSALFILDSADGTVLKEIIADGGEGNGMSTPVAIDVDLDNKVDFVYAGDLKGNLWKFDLTDSSADNWDVAYMKDDVPRPLFVARGPEDEMGQTTIQPITAKPDVMRHPSEPGYMIYFGTGKFLGTSDYSDITTQSIYGIWDYGDRIYDLALLDYTPDDDSEFLGEFQDRATDAEAVQLSNHDTHVRLLKQELTDVTIDGKNLRILSDNKPEWITVEDDTEGQLDDPSHEDANHVGWYFDLTEGERVISDLIIRDGRLIGIGFTPDDLPCSRGGSSYFMEFDARTGGRLDSAVLDINEDNEVSGGSVEEGGDYIEVDDDLLPASGLMIDGQLQTAVILGFGKRVPDCESPPCLPPDCEEPPCLPPDCEEPPCDPPPPPPCMEVKISSTSSAVASTSSGGSEDYMVEINEKCSGAGMLYWKEVQYEAP